MSNRRPWSLRRRLILGVTLLVAAIASTTGVLTVTASHGQMVDRLDQELLSAAERTSLVFSRTDFLSSRPPPRESPPPVTDFLPGQGAGAIGVLVLDGTATTAGYLGPDGGPRELTAAQIQTIVALSASGRPTTVDLGDGLGSYRVVATDINDGELIVINGLSLRDVEATTTSQITNTAAVSIAGLAVAVLLGSIIVKIAIRPLDRVAQTAVRVSKRPLESKVAVPERVAPADTSPDTEVGRVGRALNELLDRVESALIAREASEELLRQFVADASHELRTPLAVIRGYADLASRDTVDLRRSLERINAESVRMTALVEDLLLLARLDAGRDLRVERVGVALLLADAVADAHIAGPQHHWQLDLPENEVEIPGDPERLHQVIANLLSNARIHTPPGTTVETGLIDRPDSVTITVSDNGPGIPSDMVDSIFERFSRLDDSRARQTGGSGLGLAIARTIVEAHGGTIDASSTPSETRFTVTLPKQTASKGYTSDAAPRGAEKGGGG